MTMLTSAYTSAENVHGQSNHAYHYGSISSSASSDFNQLERNDSMVNVCDNDGVVNGFSCARFIPNGTFAKSPTSASDAAPPLCRFHLIRSLPLRE